MSTDNTRSGSRGFTPDQQDKVVRAFLALSLPRSIDDISLVTGISGRTVRAIIAERDGIDFLVAGGDSGLMPASQPDQAKSMTDRLASQAAMMQARIHRRKQYARVKFTPEQGSLL